MRRHPLTRTLPKWLLVAAVCALWLTVAAPMASATETTVSYVVRQGDTLETIAAAHGLTVKGLLALNPYLAGADVVYVGESLQVPSPTGPLPTVEIVCPLRYAVRDGDTLAAIAGAHGVDPGTLAQVNRRDPGGLLVAGTQLCIPVVFDEVSSIGTATPVAKMECADEVQYILAGPHSATFAFSNKALAPGLQVCVQGVSGVATGFSMLKVATETGETGWIASRHVGTWSAYRASIDPSIPTPTATPRPTRTPRPTAVPRPTRTPTPISTAASCRDAWGASAVAYRVRQGPGTGHAHTGKHVSAGQPVCELRRDQGWVFVRLADGTLGWVHADGITNQRPTPTPVPTSTPAAPPTPTATPQTAAVPAPAVVTASGIVIRNHDYDYAIDLSAAWVKEWGGHTEAFWTSDSGSVHMRTYLQPAGTTLEQFAQRIRDGARQDWWEDASLFEINSFERRQVEGQERYVLKYRVRESPEYCILDVEEAIVLTPSQAGPARGFRVQHLMCDWEKFDAVRRQVLDSLRIFQVPSYYGQYLDVDGLGIWVKAPGRVDPRALHAAADTVRRMLARIRPGIPACLTASGADLAIIPKGSYVYELPEFADSKGTPDIETVSGLGGVPGQPVSSTSEVNLLRLPGDQHAFVDVAIHEYAHAIMNLCFNAAERAKNKELYTEAQRAGWFTGEYAMTNVDEFFAVFTTIYFDENSELSHLGIPRQGGSAVLRRKYPGIHAFMEQIYNSR